MTKEIPLTINPEKTMKFLGRFFRVFLFFGLIFGASYSMHLYYLRKDVFYLIISSILFFTLIEEIYSFYKKRESILFR